MQKLLKKRGFYSGKVDGWFGSLTVKELQDDLKYNEDFVRTGYVGSVCGVPVIVTKAITNKNIYLASKEAVTLFIKKDTEVEQERDANVRNNKVYIRKVAVVALTDETKVVKLVPRA